jgi:hypothetical protein
MRITVLGLVALMTAAILMLLGTNLECLHHEGEMPHS